MLPSIEHRLAEEIGVKPSQIQAAVALLDEGATVPFIARYRKEATNGMDDAQLRLLAERLIYLRELEERRVAVLDSIREQDKLTPELQNEIENADTKQRLEDLYLPYKPKRRTKAQIAREAGLQPLADQLLADPQHNPDTLAGQFVDAEKGVPDVKAALEGARQILMEQFAEDASLLGDLRDLLNAEAMLKSSVVEGKETEGAKFRDWFEYAERMKEVPSHRALALLRGRNEGVLRLAIKLPEELEDTPRTGLSRPEGRIAARFDISDRQRPADRWLLETVRWAWMVKISLHLELELMSALRERAEEEAIRVFGANLHDLLLAAPAGPRVTMGLDPGVRTGVKVAVVDATGKVLDTATVYPHEPRRDWDGSLHTLAQLARTHRVELIAIGNGTASRETDKLAADLIKREAALKMTKIVVSEAGASVYSASELASQEFPNLDVSLRGAVSIARRLQDPLAELVKIDPKSIGVGQYQHDVSQTRLARALDGVVEDCVNAVGVDVNTASAPLLARIAGLNTSLAQNIVSYRDQHGAYANRESLKNVPRLGEKTFEQAAGFLRVMNGTNPLDASAVHPEAYPLVERILSGIKKQVRELIGDSRLIKSLRASDYTDARFGLPTVQDILKELEKPGRDPRPAFRTATFQDGVETVKDLQPGMLLEGVVTNVTNFGAFVDIGVHQDGLVHVSALSNRFIKDPREVVKAGDIVKVRVQEVDLARNRIALTMRLDDKPSVQDKPRTPGKPAPKQASAPANNAIAAAFAKLKA
jgi:uncharacterized protein